MRNKKKRFTIGGLLASVTEEVSAGETTVKFPQCCACLLVLTACQHRIQTVDPATEREAVVQVLNSNGQVIDERIYCTRLVRYVGNMKSTSFTLGYSGFGISGANSGAPVASEIPSGQIELADDAQFDECAAFLVAGLSPAENAAYLRKQFTDAQRRHEDAIKSLGRPPSGFAPVPPAVNLGGAPAAPTPSSTSTAKPAK